MFKKLLEFGLGFVKDQWGWFAAVGVALTLMASAVLWHNNEVSSAASEAAAAARSQAVTECNSIQLEEELAAANLRIENMEKLNIALEDELETRSEENAEREEFISELEDRLDTFEDGRLSDRTREFVSILSERARQYHDEDN